MHYNHVPIIMNRTAPYLLIFTLFLFACTGNSFDAAQVPIVVAEPRSTIISNGSETLQGSPELAQNEDGYLAPTESRNFVDDDTVVISPTVALDLIESDIAPIVPESTPLPTTYPGPSVLVDSVPFYSYRVVNTYPHDQTAWTQGLTVVDGGNLLEGTGMWGQSSLRRTNLETGEILQFGALPDPYFGEGITVFEDRVIQLTWQSGTGFVYDSESFELLDSFGYAHQGWGITHDGQKLIVSDGTSTLHFWDPQTMAEIGQIQVTDAYGPVFQLNELEYVEGEILANIWYSDLIARISPDTGQVLGWIDLTGLLAAEARSGTESVLNGIAYDPGTERLFVTGKLWPTLYEIELVP